MFPPFLPGGGEEAESVEFKEAKEEREFEKGEAKGGGWDVQPVKVPHTSDSYRARMVHDIVADCKEATCRTRQRR